ncbi:MAG: TrmH family RNA methyltransferase, partial [Acidimicrobiia bacterium]
GGSGIAPLGPRHHEVRRLRALMREARVRRDEGAFALEGPHVVAAALDHGATLETVYLAPTAEHAFAPLLERVRAAGVRIVELKEGVLDRVSSTVTPQPIVAVAPIRTGRLDALPATGFILVLVAVQDPGNAGTLLRSAEGSGAAGVVFCGNSVDAHNPKVVRSSAGAIFGTTLVEGNDPVKVLETLGAAGRRRLGTTATGGVAPDELDLTAPLAFVLGNEAHGLAPQIVDQLDATVTIPLVVPHVESLNVAMAGTVLCFEAARQRRAHGGGG